MYAKLISHRTHVSSQLDKPLNTTERSELAAYHIERVHDFQHERLIHLIVTLFFAAFTLVVIAALVFNPLPELLMPLGILAIILFILDIAYIRHYYQLENGVQSLYELTEKLLSEKD